MPKEHQYEVWSSEFCKRIALYIYIYIYWKRLSHLESVTYITSGDCGLSCQVGIPVTGSWNQQKKCLGESKRMRVPHTSKGTCTCL